VTNKNTLAYFVLPSMAEKTSFTQLRKKWWIFLHDGTNRSDEKKRKPKVCWSNCFRQKGNSPSFLVFLSPPHFVVAAVDPSYTKNSIFLSLSHNTRFPRH